MRTANFWINLHIHAVWSESSLGTFWIAKDAKFLNADNEDSDQTARLAYLSGMFLILWLMRSAWRFLKPALVNCSKAIGKLFLGTKHISKMEGCHVYCLYFFYHCMFRAKLLGIFLSCVIAITFVFQALYRNWNKNKKYCLWKQRTYGRLENETLGFTETFHKQ